MIIIWAAMDYDEKIGGTRQDQLRRMLRFVTAQYFSIIVEPTYVLEKPLRKNCSIDTFSPSDCKTMFRFSRDDLHRLFPLLHFPQTVQFANRSAMSGEEVFLRGLYELCTGADHYIISAIFGRDASTQSRAFAYFIMHVYNNFHHLVHDNLAWWYNNGFFATSARAIMSKIGHNLDGCYVSHFIDCNCLPTSVVGGGPAEAGANAARWDDTIQRAFYNGWKSVHGLKHQTVNNAYGFTVDMCGPTTLRRNDLAVLRMSNINERFRDLQLGALIQYIIFGDSAYKRQSRKLCKAA